MSDRLLTHHLILNNNSNNTTTATANNTSNVGANVNNSIQQQRQYLKKNQLSNGSNVDILNSSPSNSLIYTTSTATSSGDSNANDDLLDHTPHLHHHQILLHNSKGPKSKLLNENLLNELGDSLEFKITTNAQGMAAPSNNSYSLKTNNDANTAGEEKVKNRRSVIDSSSSSTGPVTNSPTSIVINSKLPNNKLANNNATPAVTNHSNNSNNNNLNVNRYELSLLKELVHLGIKREKLEKALAATAYQSGTDAINWLIGHSKDSLVNNDNVLSTRDFILVLCPIGKLANQIGTFFQQSKSKCGANEAHFTNLLPYMKLSPFFKVIFLFRIKLGLK